MNFNFLGKEFNIFQLLLLSIIGIYCIGLLIHVMEVDAAQYASISLQMLEENSFLQIKHRHFDYLDKPPLLFWLSALSMGIFGVSDFAYKLPSVLALLLSLFSIYKFSRLFYDKKTSEYAVLILGTCQAFFIISHDCRTDNLLIGFSCLAIWKLISYLLYKKNIDLIIGFVAIGFAMLAKGPLGIVFPLFAVGSYILGTRNIKLFFDWKWLIGIPIIALLLFPMCVGLYQQHGTDGLKFYFWTQSFGRITGDSEWTNDLGYFYFVHTFMWSFLPWIILFIIAFIHQIKNIKNLKEYASLGGFVFTFIALSFSRFKLSHYIYIVAPFAAIMTAHYIRNFIEEKKHETLFLNIQKIISIILVLGIALITVFVFFEFNFITILLLLFMGILFFMIQNNKIVKNNMVYYSVIAMIFANGILNTFFYPQLLKYQAHSEVTFYIQEKNIPVEQLIAFRTYGHSLSFYLNTIVDYKASSLEIKDKLQQQNELWLYTNEEGLQDLNLHHVSYTIEKELEHHDVTYMSLDFLNPKTRKNILKKVYLIHLKKEI